MVRLSSRIKWIYNPNKTHIHEILRVTCVKLIYTPMTKSQRQTKIVYATTSKIWLCSPAPYLAHDDRL